MEGQPLRSQPDYGEARHPQDVTEADIEELATELVEEAHRILENNNES